ncbi:hypothetical protein MRB53_020885 [Persea americana]|uniref:Uncharacterized protein n=1 Tax=Persea americana TaxID=3435 RepID=A0ACC2L2T6_PERAE|nr:hypothetical protein MRB53_020885 [Persea americana]
MSSMWIRESCYFIEEHVSLVLHLKHVFVQISCNVLSAVDIAEERPEEAFEPPPARPAPVFALEEEPEEAVGEPQRLVEWQADDVM